MVRRKDVEQLCQLLRIEADAREDLKKCMVMLESHDDIPCPWQPEDYSLYDEAWRSQVHAMANPPPRYPHTGVMPGQDYMVKVDREDPNSDPNQRFWIGRVIEEVMKDQHQAVKMQWHLANKEFGNYRLSKGTIWFLLTL